MNRTVIAFVGATLALSGCKSTCCRKPGCTSCPPPPVPVQLYSPSTSNAAPEVWLPSAPAAPTPAAAPAPTFPSQPQTSSYAPANPSRIANLPANVSLEKPEFSETSRHDVTSLKSTVEKNQIRKPIAFVEIVPGRLATGPRPTLDELDRLARGGYRRAYVVGPVDSLSDADRRVFASRGIAIETAPDRISSHEPAYVFADNANQLRVWWTRQIKSTEYVSEEAASIRAAKLIQ